MSEDSPSFSPKKNKQHTSRASKMPKQNKNYSHEYDLWNFDEDSTKPDTVEPISDVETVDLRVIEDTNIEDVDVVTKIIDPDKTEESNTLRVSATTPAINQTIQRKGDDAIWDGFIDEETSKTQKEHDKTTEDILPEIEKSTPSHEVASDESQVETPSDIADAVLTEKTDSQAVEAEVTPIPQDKEVTKIQIPKFTKLEKIASIILLVTLVIGGFIAMKLVKDNLKTDHSAIEVPDYPTKGSYAEIKNSETFWRTPIRTGDNPDAALAEINFIPVVEISLGKCPSPTGAIRVFFRTDKKEQTGDTVTKEFKDGKFLINQSDTLTFACTSGFKEYGDQEAYRASTGNPWYAEVYEAPSLDTDAAGYKLLCRIPISKTRK